MSIRKIMLATALMVAGVAVGQEGPTMGWSSWNTFGVNISENIIKGQADAMVSKGLLDIDYIDVVSTAPAGISKTVNSKLSNSQIYDLSGRKVTTPRKGVNIINGRKVTHK